ncbi:MAG: PP2C family protein-serine/threonine phosphatase, partial [Planctomycetota bacterium]
SRLEKEPEQIFVKINNNLSNRGTLGMFVTLQYIHIQENARKAYIINGGHLPPIIYSQKTKQVRQLEVKSSPPVGIVPNQNYVSTSFDLYPEDIILLYTDGVYEAKSPDGERFETRGIIKSLKKSIEKSAPSILKALVEDVHHWTEREDHFDDFTTLLIKVS